MKIIFRFFVGWFAATDISFAHTNLNTCYNSPIHLFLAEFLNRRLPANDKNSIPNILLYFSIRLQ